MKRELIANDPMAARALDCLGAIVLLIAFAPLMLMVAIGVYIADPGPVFFSQRRIGRGGREFYCFKFRSMVIDAEERLTELLQRDPLARLEWAHARKLRHDPRILSIGSFLRKSSLDELPQLFNVLKGEMSLVGPRPIVEAEIDRYGRYFSHYCAVRPGITGLWQINGRSDVDYRRRVAFDVIYVRTSSVVDNVRILILTLPSVLSRKGSY